MELAIAYLMAINLSGFAVMGADKAKARRGRRRISERTIFTLALLGGATGVLAGMLAFRHKTRHLSFVLGIPVLVFANFMLVWFFISKTL